MSAVGSRHVNATQLRAGEHATAVVGEGDRARTYVIFVCKVTLDSERRVIKGRAADFSLGGGSFGSFEETHRADCTGCAFCPDCTAMSCGCHHREGETRPPLCDCHLRHEWCGQLLTDCECNRERACCAEYETGSGEHGDECERGAEAQS